MEADENQSGRGRAITGTLGAAFLVYLILLITGRVASGQRLGWPEYSILAFGALFANGFFRKLTEVSFGKEGIQFKMQLEKLQEERNADSELLRAMQIALLGLLDKYERGHLEKMSGEGPFFCHYGEIFFQQIKDLDAHEFLKPIQPGGFNAIEDRYKRSPLEEFDLKSFMVITPEGRRYVAAVNALVRSAPAGRVAAPEL
ncbi:MAG TPA: hypothetical protein VKZ18_21410 [Polyangia bacterium]|nr:hypothetical protein [Polyangia bacterium]